MLRSQVGPYITDPHLPAAASQTTAIVGSLMSPSSAPGLQLSANITENVHVAVRCRPLSQGERSHQVENAWQVDSFRHKIQLTDSATTTRPALQQEIHSQITRSKNKVYHFGKPSLLCLPHSSVSWITFVQTLLLMVATTLDYTRQASSLWLVMLWMVIMVDNKEDGVWLGTDPFISIWVYYVKATVFAYGQTASGKTYVTLIWRDMPLGYILTAFLLYYCRQW